MYSFSTIINIALSISGTVSNIVTTVIVYISAAIDIGHWCMSGDRYGLNTAVYVTEFCVL